MFLFSRIVWLFAKETIASDVYCDVCLLSISMTVVANVRTLFKMCLVFFFSFFCMLLGASAIGDFTCFVSGDNVIAPVNSVRKENWCSSLFLSSTVRDERRERPFVSQSTDFVMAAFSGREQTLPQPVPKVKIPPCPVGSCQMDSGPEGKKTFL